MALGMKLGIGAAIVAIGGAGLWGWQHARKTEQKPDAQAVTPVAANDSAAPAITPAPEPIRTEPPPTPTADEPRPAGGPGDNTGTLASPLPPLGVTEASERSFRAKPDAPVEHAAPLEGSTAVTTPLPATDAPPTLTEPPRPAPAPAVTADAPAPASPRSESITSTAADKPAASQPAVAKMTQHVIQAGETYTSLAEKYLGHAKYANLIAKANPGKDPRKLFVGAKINIPAAPKEASTTKPETKDAAAATSARLVRVPAEPAPPIPPDRAYTVRPGESWNDLAQRFLGNRNRWPELFELNKDRVPANPGALRSGTVIEVPPGVKLTTQPS